MATPEHAEKTYIEGKNGGRLQRGNPGGRPAIKREIVEAIRAGLPGVAQALLNKAAKGDTKAIELCLHYGIGKPTDKVEVSGPEGGPIPHVDLFTDEQRRALRDALRAVAGDDTGPASGP